MRHPIILGLTACFLATSLQAQSTISLEEFDLGEPAPTATAATKAKSASFGDCLLDAGGCANSDLKAGSDFSLEDVVNLKVESNAGTAIVPAATTSQSVGPLPSIDMEILFDYNSDDVRPDQMTRLFELAEVLRDERFAEYTFLFVGHSDAKGSAAYNQELSARRAKSVANFVQASARLSQENFAASGIGFSRLKDPADPLGPQNRRVQLVLVPQ
jgi:outer membrane protein OmpA-like peptidoglycan-associated protein